MAITGEFLGFSFDGKHSSELKIVRTSTSNRYDKNLYPTIQDKTVQVPGADGTYYFNSYYTQKPFNLNIAYDNLTEEDVKAIEETFAVKNKLVRLIYDEAPFKYYMVKPTGTSQLKFMCFEENYFDSEDNTWKIRNIYKGEGTLSFIAYYPYAKSVFKYLDEFSETISINENEDLLTEKEKLYYPLEKSGVNNDWKNAYKFLETKGNYDVQQDGQLINLYNAGQMEADFYLYIKFPDDNTLIDLYQIQIDNDVNKSLIFSSIIKQGNDTHIRINSKTNLIEGCIIEENEEEKDVQITENLYNKYIIQGDFFKIPLLESVLHWTLQENSDANYEVTIDYDYIFY